MRSFWKKKSRAATTCASATTPPDADTVPFAQAAGAAGEAADGSRTVPGHTATAPGSGVAGDAGRGLVQGVARGAGHDLWTKGKEFVQGLLGGDE